MRIPREKAERELVNITPLIDVVFILLIFFMLAGSIKPTAAFEVTPPESISDLMGDAEDFVILVAEDGRVAIGDRRVERDELTAVVRRALETQPGLLVQLKPDAEADAAKVIAIMEDVREAGASYVVLLTTASAARP